MHAFAFMYNSGVNECTREAIWHAVGQALTCMCPPWCKTVVHQEEPWQSISVLVCCVYVIEPVFAHGNVPPDIIHKIDTHIHVHTHTHGYLSDGGMVEMRLRPSACLCHATTA
jgi:hypothetical protein